MAQLGTFAIGVPVTGSAVPSLSGKRRGTSLNANRLSIPVPAPRWQWSKAPHGWMIAAGRGGWGGPGGGGDSRRHTSMGMRKQAKVACGVA